ncbi:hypothetical protein MTR67_025500 [Solanum verrucosum]|uniref:Uncharacterized protein n=1 Tax=Solanum verrucosum TaxID=315347 RepID=A0AAF0R3N3_SOLVR|nr:hypothetical protein MTR67_025500 [Solanum verrucosum]
MQGGSPLTLECSAGSTTCRMLIWASRVQLTKVVQFSKENGTILVYDYAYAMYICDVRLKSNLISVSQLIDEDTFGNLKFLKLEEVILAKWKVGDESFPVLEKLDLLECYKLEEIPPSFGDIGSLNIIKLVRSPDQLEDSAMKIKEYAEDMRGGDKLQVLGPNNIPLFK